MSLFDWCGRADDSERDLSASYLGVGLEEEEPEQIPEPPALEKPKPPAMTALERQDAKDRLRRKWRTEHGISGFDERWG